MESDAQLRTTDDGIILQSKKLLALLRKITSKHRGAFYCLNCFHSFAAKNKLESQRKPCEDKDFCNIVMLSDDTKKSAFNQNQKSDKAPFIIYRVLDCILQNIDGFKNNPETSSTTKVSENTPMSALSSFRSRENKHDV